MASDAVFEFTDSNFDDEVLNADVPVLVDFWAEWCQPCRIIAPTIEALAGEYGAKAKIGRMDCDSNRQTPVRFGISAIPTLILFKNGEVEKKFVGVTPKHQLDNAIGTLV